MVTEAVLHALAKAVGSGVERDAFHALSNLDPILRILARRRLRRLIDNARRSVSGNDDKHAFRVALLMAANGTPDAALDDTQAIAAECDAIRAGIAGEPPNRRWLTAVIGAGLVLLVSLALLYVVLTRRFDPLDTTAGELLGRSVPGYLVEVNRAARSGRKDEEGLIARADTVLTSRARDALGPEASTELTLVLHAAAKVVTDNDASTPASDTFLAAAGAFNRAVARQGLPYFMDSDLFSLGDPPVLTPMLFSFYIERESEVHGAGTPVRVVHLWRLDNLNLAQGFVGYTRPRSEAALVLLDQIESELVRYVLPALPEGEEALLVDHESLQPESEWQKALHARSGEIVRAYYARPPGADPAAVARIGELLARRRKLIRNWQRSIDRAGMRLLIPERLIPEGDYHNDLLGKVPVTELREWTAIHEELIEPDTEKTFRLLRDRYAASVEQHEVQHRLDYTRGLIPIPEVLKSLLGIEDVLDAPEGTLRARARDELSAYLAQIARGADSPALDLMLLSRFIFDRRFWGDAYCYAALSMFDGLGRELGLPDTHLTGYGRILRDNLTERFLAITAKPPDEIRAAARRLWEKSYGDKLPDVQEGKVKQFPAWRH